jgi:hypothetical protein
MVFYTIATPPHPPAEVTAALLGKIGKENGTYVTINKNL